MEYSKKITTLSQLKITSVINMLGISRNKYYSWYKRLGIDNAHNGKIPKSHWTMPGEIDAIIEYAKKFFQDNPFYIRDGYRRIAYSGLDNNVFAVSPSTVYRVLSRAGLLDKWGSKKNSCKGLGYKQPTGPHQEWHTDIKYVNFKGTYLFLISVMDGYSRYILHHELRTSMTELDVEITVQRAIEKYPDKKARIISDNGKQYLSKDFQAYIKEIGLQHSRISLYYPQSNGKIERFHRSLSEECISKKSMINMEDAKKQIADYIEQYNNYRLHSALFYLRPVDFLSGNVEELLKVRQNKLDRAEELRRQYWEEQRHVA